MAVLAEQGFTQTSFARIREHAQLSSTRLISYHFADKAELLQAVIERIVAASAEVMVPAMDREETIRGKLAAYIRSNMAFLADHPAWARAAIEIIANVPRPQNEVREDTSAMLLAVLLAQGQQAGEMRAFDPAIMAHNVRAAIDAFAARLPQDPSLVDVAIFETVTLFDRATAA